MMRDSDLRVFAALFRKPVSRKAKRLTHSREASWTSSGTRLVDVQFANYLQQRELRRGDRH